MPVVDVSGVLIQQAPAGNEVSGRQWRGRLRRAKAERGGAGLKLLTKAVVSDDGRSRNAAMAGECGARRRRAEAAKKVGGRQRQAKAAVEVGRRRR